jgi:hypothetical protein
MSSASIIFSMDKLVRAALRFRYVDFLVKSTTPAISLAFIVYVTFKGVFWQAQGFKNAGSVQQPRV